MINNDIYINRELFSKEKEYFTSGWVFIGLTTDLKKNNSFITLKNAFCNIVVQNFGGELKAFDNICAHRFHSIQEEFQGRRPLVCKYHSWGYDKNGCSRNDTNVKLKNYPISIVGIFVFVNLGTKKERSLSEFLGKFYTKLESLSTFIDEEIDIDNFQIKHKANWKLLVENVTECYHCQSVHKESLGILGMGKGDPYNFEFSGIHNSIEYPLYEEDSIQLSKLNKLLVDRPFKHNSYLHIMVAPNLFISSTSGKFYYVGRMDPITVDRTNLILMFKSSKFKNVPENLIYQMLKIGKENTITVVNEDKNIVENIQENLKFVPNRESKWSELEHRIIHFYTNFKTQ